MNRDPHPAAFTSAPRAEVVVELLARELNDYGGTFCPNPRAGMQLWNMHPRVALDVADTGAAKCPYCGTIYRLAPGETVGPAH